MAGYLLPELDEKCPECGGVGAMTCGHCSGWECMECNYAGEIVCGVCNGKQRILTQDGEELLAFLDRHRPGLKVADYVQGYRDAKHLPEIVEAAREMLAVTPSGRGSRARQKLGAAIAKATGEEQA